MKEYSGKRNPGSCGTGTKSGGAGRYLAVGKTISSLREDLDRPTLLIIKASQHDTNHIQNLPDKEAAASAELDDTSDDLAGVDAVHAAEAAENQQAEEEGDEAGTGGLITGAVGAAAHGVFYGLLGLKKFLGADQLGIARVG